MITKKELEGYARLKALTMGNAEKDYLLDIALLSISRHTKDELVFKGGTCLYKFHKLSRFSEDLDFSATRELDINHLLSQVILDFRRYGITATMHRKKESRHSVLATIRLEGPLYAGKPSTYASLGIDINLKSEVFTGSESRHYNSLYPEIPAMLMLCMKPEEICAEKIRALLTRNRARDLFDLHFLLEKGIYASESIIRKKMEYYGDAFTLRKLLLQLKALEPHWKKELEGFTHELPAFQDVRKSVEAKLMERYQH